MFKINSLVINVQYIAMSLYDTLLINCCILPVKANKKACMNTRVAYLFAECGCWLKWGWQSLGRVFAGILSPTLQSPGGTSGDGAG